MLPADKESQIFGLQNRLAGFQQIDRPLLRQFVQALEAPGLIVRLPVADDRIDADPPLHDAFDEFGALQSGAACDDAFTARSHSGFPSAATGRASRGRKSVAGISTRSITKLGRPFTST